jgi:hypothetical protein
MPRRLRNLINSGQTAANNANALIDNADSTLNEIDKVIDKIVEQGFVELDIELFPNLPAPLHAKIKVLIPKSE